MRCDHAPRARQTSLRTAGAAPRPGAVYAPRRTPADPVLLAAILGTLDDEDRRRARQRAAAAMVAAAGAVVLARRGPWARTLR